MDLYPRSGRRNDESTPDVDVDPPAWLRRAEARRTHVLGSALNGQETDVTCTDTAGCDIGRTRAHG